MVSPGLWGFVAFFVLALALYLLMRNMNARMRRMSYAAQERERVADAKAGRRDAEADDPTAGDPKSGDPKSGEPKSDGPSADGDEGRTGESAT
jgi:hypothetical protein